MAINELHYNGYVAEIMFSEIAVTDNQVIFTDDADDENDIIRILTPDIYESEFLGNVYYFGYIFNQNASRHDRTTVLKWMKDDDFSGISESAVRKFIDRPLSYLNRHCNLSTFDLMLSPKSGRSNLTRLIVNEIYAMTQHSMERKSFEFIKNIPYNIQFDDVIAAIQTGKVLIVDDINTTGSTLKEIIRLIRNINNDCEIYIFTLIGKP